MKVKELLQKWNQNKKTEKSYTDITIRLTDEDAAKIFALTELFPHLHNTDILSDIISASLREIETSLPYIKGELVVSQDELGDPIYEDAGLTPQFISLTQKYLQHMKPH